MKFDIFIKYLMRFLDLGTTFSAEDNVLLIILTSASEDYDAEVNALLAKENITASALSNPPNYVILGDFWLIRVFFFFFKLDLLLQSKSSV